ncbi:hypothetical protein ACFVMC_11415 [Nocardia sp. NPDC127579]|uniref:hypothetical protein n=1 Tax=Nocardia sp. NPDC127579 TaxID=3345402 RepID=UPI00363A09A7
MKMTRRTRRRTLTAVQRQAALLQPFALDEFGAILAAASGIPVRILASDSLPPAVAGRWIRTGSGDLIEYDADLPDIARINTVLHEAGHILHGHTSLEVGPALCSIISPAAINNFARVRYRSAYDSASEREAETFARQTLRAMLWSDTDIGESANIRGALGFPRTRIG